MQKKGCLDNKTPYKYGPPECTYKIPGLQLFSRTIWLVV